MTTETAGQHPGSWKADKALRLVEHSCDCDEPELQLSRTLIAPHSAQGSRSCACGVHPIRKIHASARQGMLG